MLPVCPILVFQLNWKHLSVMGTSDGTGVKLAGREAIPSPRIWGTLKQAGPSGFCTPGHGGKGVEAGPPQGGGAGIRHVHV